MVPAVVPTVPVSGLVTTKPVPSTTATVTLITVTTTPTVLLPLNSTRKGFILQNQDQVTFIKFDTTSSVSLYTYELPRKGILEKDSYVGPVTAVTASGSTSVLVTELI